MKAVILTAPKSYEYLKIVSNRLIPEPKADEIRVKVHAVGLNPVDYKLVNGWGDVKWDFPVVLGLDVAGIIDKVGKNVTTFVQGDKVYYHGNLSKENGGFAEYACTTAHTVSRIPNGLDMIGAAALPCSGFTAYQAVKKKLKPISGKTILIHAGAGGVGGYAIQLAKLENLKIFTTCSERNFEYVKELGADFAIDYNTQNIEDYIKYQTGGRGVDYIINTVDSATATTDIDLLAFGGELVAVVEHPDFNKINFYEKAMSLHEVALGGAHINGDYSSQLELAEIGRIMADYIVEGIIKLPQIKVIQMEEIPKYLEMLETRHVAGKIVAKISE